MTTQQQRFADKVLEGMDAAKAYRASGYRAKAAAAQACASRLLARGEVADYISEGRAKLASASERTRADYRELLTGLAWDGAEATRDRLRAGEQLSRLCGWDTPARTEGKVRIVIGGDAC
jgi:phage terminase small subunit